jgi:hypothetical protein
MKEAGLPLDTLAAHGCRMMCWRLDNQEGFVSSPCRPWGEEAHFDGALIGYGGILVFTGRSRKLIPPLGCIGSPILA